MSQRKSKYRVKVVVVDTYIGVRTKYVIQKRTIVGWVNLHDATTDKIWAYQTCEEMNTDYETIRNQRNA